jgi:hypothetical protein
VFRNRTRRFWIIVIVIAAAVVFYLPSLVAYRYTASTQSADFLTHPWRSWSFIYTALTIPGDSKLKTSGQALRQADAVFAGTAIDPQEVRLLFLPADKPYTFTHALGDRTVRTTVTPSSRFVWQVTGNVDTVPGAHGVIIALLDYRTGKLLYDVRRDLQPGQVARRT